MSNPMVNRPAPPHNDYQADGLVEAHFIQIALKLAAAGVFDSGKARSSSEGTR
jgi:hypothetical protein